MEKSPIVARRRLGLKLRELREQAGIWSQEAARRIEVSQPTLSRIETGKSVPKGLEIFALGDLYGISQSTLEALIELAETGRQHFWGDDYRDVLRENRAMLEFAGLEEEASSISTFSRDRISAYLQSTSYAKSAYQALHPGSPEHSAYRWTDFLARRREAVFQIGDTTRLHVILDESALIRDCGGRAVMLEQLELLLAWCAEESVITLQILPFSAGPLSILQGDTTALYFDDSSNPSTILLEHRRNGDCLETRKDIVSGFEDDFRTAREISLNGEGTVRRIEQAIMSLKDE